jgi:hypothetical protein
MIDVGALAPDLVPELAAAAATTKARCRILAELADAIGVSEAAAALRAHGDELAA